MRPEDTEMASGEARRPEIGMGQTVVDVVTGFKGTVIQRIEMFEGTTQFAVQPSADPQEPGDYPDGRCIDEDLLLVDEDALPRIAANRITEPAADDLKIPLGYRVRDLVSGFEGITTQRVIFINGCVYYLVIPKITKAKAIERPDGALISSKYLRVVSKGLTATVSKPRSQKAPGGPSTKVRFASDVKIRAVRST